LTPGEEIVQVAGLTIQKLGEWGRDFTSAALSGPFGVGKPFGDAVAETVFGPVIVGGEFVEGAAEFRSELARTADETERQAKKVQQIEGVCVTQGDCAILGNLS
jgi:hypothetical protein